MRDMITVAGALAQRPGRGGHAWVFLQYLLGLRRLGWDVHFVDRLEPGMDRAGIGYLADVLARADLAGCWTLLDGPDTHGVGRAGAARRLRDSALLLNVMGYLDDADLLAAAPRRVFLDIDPGFPQMWCELGLADAFAGHDAFVTVGENVGRPGCLIPTCGLDWITTRPPVVLDEWPRADAAGGAITTVAAWRGPFGPIDYHGATYGLRVHEFRRFLDLPRRTGARFELALDIDDADASDAESLRRNGFALVDPASVAADPWRYRDYVQASAAELCVAKNLYVATRGGWFSDRSACYLASGRPVLAQDTGADLPCGDGLILFATPDEAAAGIAEVLGEPARHARAAREIAEAYFGSDVVLARLLADLGVS
jgi:hypothetical protein